MREPEVEVGFELGWASGEVVVVEVVEPEDSIRAQMRTASVRWEFKNGKIKSDREQTYSLRSRGRLIQMRWNSLHKRTQHDCERSASFVSFESTEQKAKPTLTVIRYSTALSGLLKLARSAFIT